MGGYINTLIVDDEPINTFVVSAFLENLGQKSLTCENGLDALQMLKAHSDIDLILLDLNMPVKDGYEFLADIENDKLLIERKFDIVIISASPKVEFETQVKLRNISTKRVIGFIEKPIEFEQIESIYN